MARTFAMALALSAGVGLFDVAVGQPGPGQNSRNEVEYRPGEVLLRFGENVNPSRIDAIRNEMAAIKLKRHPATGIEHWRLPRGLEVTDAVRTLSARAEVRYAEPNYALHAFVIPNDPRMAELWGMYKISAPAAWDITTGTQEIVVGVIDTGGRCGSRSNTRWSPP